MNKGDCKAILCDFDGVLGVTGQDNYKAWSTILLEFDIALNEEEYFLTEGKNSPQLLREILTEHGHSLDLIPKLIEKKQALYTTSNSFSFYPGTTELIDLAKRKSLKLGVVSGGSQNRLTKPEAIKVISNFDTIITAADTDNAKPAPDPYLLAAERLKVDPSNCIVIENAPLGIEAAIKANMFCIAIPSTLDKKHLFKAHLIVDNLSKVPPIIEELYL